MAEVREILLKSYSSTSTEEVSQATNALLELQNNPEAIFVFYQIFASNDIRTLRQSAIVAFGKTLKNTWKQVFVGNENGEKIKSLVLEFFNNETDSVLTFTLVHAIDTIFKTDAASWSNIYTLIFQLAQGSPNQLALSLYLSQYLIPKLSAEQIDIASFCQLAANALQAQDPDIIVHACGLASVIIYYTNLTESKEVQVLFDLIMNAFQASLSDPKFAARVSARIAFCFKTEDFHIPAPDLVSHLLTFFDNEELNPNLYLPIFTLIEELVGRFGKDLREMLPQLLMKTILMASRIYNEDQLYEGQEDMIYILGTFETISKTVRNRRLFDEIFQSVQQSDAEEPPSLFMAKIIAFFNIIEHCSEAIMKNIDGVCNFLIERLNIGILGVQEVAVMALEEIGKLLQEGQDSIGNNILRPLIEMICSDQVDPENPDLMVVIDHALDAIAKILSTIDIDSEEYSQTLLQTVKTYIDNGISRSKCFNVLSNLVFSIGEGVSNYSDDLLELMSEWIVNMAEGDDPTLKQNMIEALGNILRFCKNINDEKPRMAADYIIQSYDTEDLEIRSAIIVAIENLILIKSPVLAEYSEQLIVIINQALELYVNTAPEDENEAAEEDELGDDEEDFEESHEQLQIRYIQDAILMMRMLYKYLPELVPEDDSEWARMILNMMGSGSEDIQVASTQCAAYFCLRKISIGIDVTEFYVAALKNISDESSFVAGAAFKFFASLFEKLDDAQRAAFPEQLLSELIQQATQALKQEYDDDDGTMLENSARLYRFWAAVATSYPQFFPLAEFIDHGNKLQREESFFEISQFIGVLRQFYNSTNALTGVPEILKKFVIKHMMNIDICDFSVIPEPILGIMAIAEKEPQIVYNHLQSIIEKLLEILQADETGEMHYFSTKADAMSLICTLLNKFPDDMPWDDCAACMAASLPVRGDDMEAEHIYSSLLAYLSSREEIQAFKDQLYEGFKAALEDAELIKAVNENTKQSMARFVSSGPYE